ncbi:MAG: S-methyl-5'-thioinosine phosphorylase [Pseudomonadota bacterium]
MNIARQLAVIGGTGTEQWPDAELLNQYHPETPFGHPSAPVQAVSLAAREVLFLSRHGAGHDIAPHLINYRANIMALKSLGATHIVALNAVGIIGDEAPAGGLLLPDQLIDYTSGRQHTFFDGTDEPLQHVAFDEPYDADLRDALLAAAATAQVPLSNGGVYGVTQGPRLETIAEVNRLARDGVTVIGMTGMPEAVLARELGMAYASVALIVNKAAGRGSGDIHAELHANMAAARAASEALVTILCRQSP